jgi:sugar phosphate permease
MRVPSRGSFETTGVIIGGWSGQASLVPSPVETPIVGPNSFDVEALYANIAWRIMPFLVLLFVVAWLDRINVGFARLQMVKDLGFSDAVYGFGAGIFYLGYFLFEVPSNLVLERIGARRTFTQRRVRPSELQSAGG